MKTGPASDLGADRTQFSNCGFLLSAALRFGDRLEEWIQRIPAPMYFVGLLLLIVYTIASGTGTFLHPQADNTIPHYLSHRSILEKIFDPSVEIGFEYRPRPLSYFVDDLDVAFIARSTRLGLAHVLSASAIVFWILGALLLWHLLRHYIGLDRFSSGAMVALLSTDPVFFCEVRYFRSAKSGAAFCLLAATVCFARCFERNERGQSGVRAAIAGGVLLFCGCLFDEQPAAFAVAAILLLALNSFLHRDTAIGSASRQCLVATTAALVAFGVYDFVIHPRLLEVFTGQVWSAAYQKETARLLLAQSPRRLLASAEALGDAFGALLGDIRSVLAFGLLAVIASTFSVRNGDRKVDSRLWIKGVLADGALQVILGFGLLYSIIVVMVARHPPLLWPELRRTEYYLAPTLAFIIIFAAGIQNLLQRRHLGKKTAHFCLLLLMANNLIVWRHRMGGSEEFPTRLEFTQRMLQALRSREGITPAMLQDPQQSAIWRQVQSSPSYQVLRKYRDGQE